MINTFLTLITSVALAGTYYGDIDIDQDPLQYSSEASYVTPFIGVADGYADTIVPSTWSYIECQIVNGDVRAEFTATSTNWPTYFPSSVTCAGGGEALVLTLMDVESTIDHEENVDPQLGINLTVSPNTMVENLWFLPSGFPYGVALHQARITPMTVWDGVWCGTSLHTDGRYSIRLTVDNMALANSGYCPIENSSGGPGGLLPVTISRQ